MRVFVDRWLKKEFWLQHHGVELSEELFFCEFLVGGLRAKNRRVVPAWTHVNLCEDPRPDVDVNMTKIRWSVRELAVKRVVSQRQSERPRQRRVSRSRVRMATLAEKLVWVQSAVRDWMSSCKSDDQWWVSIFELSRIWQTSCARNTKMPQTSLSYGVTVSGPLFLSFLSFLLLFVIFIGVFFFGSTGECPLGRVEDLTLDDQPSKTINGPPGAVSYFIISKTQKRVIDASMLFTQYYKVRIKGK